jgi:RNA polymerase sigma-70 factor, ECF subfamily
MEMAAAVPPSFAQVAEDLSSSLLHYLARYAGDRDLAEDLLQETMIRIARALPGFQQRSELKTWALSIATRVAADHFRKPANRLSIIDVADIPELPDSERLLDQQLVIDEMNACVRQVIDSLPADYRAALVLHDLEGMTAEETAEVSGCSVAAAKIRIHRARRRLSEALRHECDFYRDGEDVFRCQRRQE